MIKGNPQRIKHFAKKNKRCDICLPISCIRLLLSRDHRPVVIMNIKAKCKVLSLNTWAIIRNARGASRHPPLMGNCLTCTHMS